MLSQFFSVRRNQIIAGAVVAVMAVGAVAFAVAAGDGEEAAPTTTEPSTTTTAETTTTSKVPRPVAPLTGVNGDHEGRINRPALVVKYDNVEPKARPQAGINQADVVYEERVEGSVTRLLAVFHSTDAAPVGPVRSARTSDIAIFSPLNRPYFAWSGANALFAQRIRESAVFDIGYDVQSGHYFRDGGRPAPSNLMAHGTADLLSIPTEGSAPPKPLFKFRPRGNTTPHRQKVNGVRVSYGSQAGAAPVEYIWNGTGWARTQKGTPHVDSAGLQVAPENVIVQFTPYVSSGVNDQFGVPIPEAQMVGEGDVWVFTNGGVVMGRWRKTSVDQPTQYLDVDGNHIRVNPGRTWVALPQPGGGQLL